MTTTGKLQFHGHDSIPFLLPLFLAFLAFLFDILADVVYSHGLLSLHIRCYEWVYPYQHYILVIFKF